MCSDGAHSDKYSSAISEAFPIVAYYVTSTMDSGNERCHQEKLVVHHTQPAFTTQTRTVHMDY